MSGHDGQREPRHAVGGPNRRKTLQLAALVAGGFLAGCGGDGDGDSGGDPTTEATTTEGVGPGVGGDTTTENGDGGDDPTTTESVPEEYDHVEQEFLMPTTRQMQEVHFFGPDTAGVYWDYHYFTRDTPAYGPWCHSDYLGTGEISPQMYADVTHEPGRFEITVRDDANWSNGDPVTGRDAIMGPVAQRIHSGARSFAAVEERGINQPWDAITDYEYDGKTGILHSSGEWFDDLVDTRYWLKLLEEHGPRWHTELAPFDRFSDALFDTFDQAAGGELDPWESDDPALRGELLAATYGADREELHQQFRDPGEVVVHGAWTLEELQGDQRLTLVPNEHHYNYDDINFDRVVLEYAESANVIQQSLDTGRYDIAQAAPPSHVAEEFPDMYDAYFAPDNNGVSLVCNGKADVVENPRVRQAIAAALDQPEICNTLYPRTWEPLQTPGPDNFAKPPFLDDEWFDENLQNYDHDLELAAECMRLGDYEQNSDGTWVDADGEVAQIELHTQSGAPQYEQLIVEQLNAFGIEAEMQTLDPALFESELADGSLQTYTGDMFAGSAFTAVADDGGWTYMAWHQNHVRRYGWLDAPVSETIQETEWDDEGFIVSFAPEYVDHMTIEAPAVGDFYADDGMQEWSPVVLSSRLESANRGVPEEVWPELVWLSNWHMPAIPLATVYKQFFLNTDNWVWNRDRSIWDYLGVTTRLMPQRLHGWGGQVFADPENPK